MWARSEVRCIPYGKRVRDRLPKINNVAYKTKRSRAHFASFEGDLTDCNFVERIKRVTEY